MARRYLQLACACLFPLPLAAQDFVTVPGALSDDDFYRAVSCGAAPGTECTKPVVKWDTQRPLRVSLRQIHRTYLGGRAKRAGAALERAIQRINAAKADLRLLRIGPNASAADIEVYFLDQEKGDTITGTGIEGVDGTVLGGASTRVFFDKNGRIKRAVVLYSTTMQMRAYESSMLEEITQSLGLLTDIRSPHYDRISVFAQDSNAATRLGPQDIMALRRHYPR